MPQGADRSIQLTTRARLYPSLQIVVETARFVRRGGGQVEVLMRVRQAGNRRFAFLMPGDRVFPYYRWVVDTNPQVSYSSSVIV